MTNETTFNPFSLIIGVLSVIASLLVMRNPLSSIASLAFLIGAISIVQGISKIIEIRKVDQLKTIDRRGWYFSSVLDILFGVLLFIMPGFGVAMIWITISLFVILNAVIEFWVNQFTDIDHGGYYWLNLVMSVLGFIIGIVLLFKPMLAISFALFFLSFALMFFGITKIARSF